MAGCSEPGILIGTVGEGRGVGESDGGDKAVSSGLTQGTPTGPTDPTEPTAGTLTLEAKLEAIDCMLLIGDGERTETLPRPVVDDIIIVGEGEREP